MISETINENECDENEGYNSSVYYEDGESERDTSVIVISDEDQDATTENGDKSASMDNYGNNYNAETDACDYELAVVPYNLHEVTDVYSITFYRTMYLKDGSPVMSNMYWEQ